MYVLTQVVFCRCEDNSSTLAFLIDQLKVKSKDADVEMDDSTFAREAISTF